MYTLRIVEETRENLSAQFEQIVENHELGSSYSKIKKDSSSEFSSISKSLYPKEDVSDVELMICGENEKVFLTIKNTDNHKFYYYIMGDSGNTFEKL